METVYTALGDVVLRWTVSAQFSSWPSCVMLFSTLLSTLQGSAVVTPARPRASPGRNAAKDGDWRQLHHLLHDGGWQAEVDRDRRGASALHLAGRPCAARTMLGSSSCASCPTTCGENLPFGAFAGWRH